MQELKLTKIQLQMLRKKKQLIGASMDVIQLAVMAKMSLNIEDNQN